MHSSFLPHRFWRTAMAAMVVPVAIAAAEVATVPVGAIALNAPGPATEGGNPVATLFSLPLEAAPAWRSISTEISGSTLTDGAANWAANIFTTTGSPHFLEILSGPATGRSFLISSHTADSVTVSHRIAGETLEAAAGTGPVQFQILPGHTLATVFGADGEGLRKSTSASNADNVLLWSGTGWETYYFHPSANVFRRVGSLVNQNSTIIHPDEAVFLVRREPSPYQLILTGFAPTLGKRTEIGGAGATMASNRLPTNTTLGELALQNLPGWRVGTTASSTDNVLLWNGTAWVTYYRHSTGVWRRVGSLVAQDNEPISAGAGFFVIRRGDSNSPTELFLQNLNYDLSL